MLAEGGSVSVHVGQWVTVPGRDEPHIVVAVRRDGDSAERVFVQDLFRRCGDTSVSMARGDWGLGLDAEVEGARPVSDVVQAALDRLVKAKR